MSCQSATLSVIDARCDTSIGGIKRILIANQDDVLSVEISTASTNANKLITSITLAAGKVFKQWLFRKNTGSYTSTLATDPAIGNNTVTTEVSLQFSRAEAEKRLSIQSAINAAAVVIVEDMFGQYIYLGKENEVTITAATMQSGVQTSDLNGFNLTFQDIASELPYFVEPSIVPALLTGSSASDNQQGGGGNDTPATPTTYTVTYKTGSNMTSHADVVESYAAGTTVTAKNAVQLGFTASSGSVNSSYNATGLSSNYVTQGNTFVMPAGNVVLTATGSGSNSD